MKKQLKMSIILGATLAAFATTAAYGNGSIHHNINSNNTTKTNLAKSNSNSNSKAIGIGIGGNSYSKAYGGSAKAYGGSSRAYGGDAEQDQSQRQSSYNRNDLDNSTDVTNKNYNSDYNSVRNSNDNTSKAKNEGNNTELTITDNSVYEDAYNPVNSAPMTVPGGGSFSTPNGSASYTKTNRMTKYQASVNMNMQAYAFCAQLMRGNVDDWHKAYCEQAQKQFIHNVVNTANAANKYAGRGSILSIPTDLLGSLIGLDKVLPAVGAVSAFGGL